jgi:hypothetical protein
MALPILTVVSPTPGATITQFQQIIFRVTDADDDLAQVLVYGTLDPNLPDEVIHDGLVFSPRYDKLSEIEAIALGFEYTLIREGGWPVSQIPDFHVCAIDDLGGILP